MILDGWGIAQDKSVSAIDKACTPFMDSVYATYSHSTLNTSGLAVGLPEGQMGNSEVGHINIGAGRVVYQNLVKINKAIEQDTLKDEKTIKEAFSYAKENKKKVHLLGLVSNGGVHSHINHLKGIITAADQACVKDVFVHAFMDGRDCDPKSGKGFIAELQAHLEGTTVKLASLIGRFYAMDRDKRWDRLKKAYDLLVKGEGLEISQDQVIETIEKSYKDKVSDEFLAPMVITEEGKPLAKIEEGDVVFCYNFRTDRCREITQVLSQSDFPDQGMRKMDLYFVTMTQYDENFKNVHVVYREDKLKNTLGEVLETHGKKQIRIAETEKYPHVTFFFSGGKENEFKGEKRLMCPSPKDVKTYDLKPEMAAYDIKNAILPELKKGEVDFVCLNFANPDMVGHTGVMAAAIKACEVVDECAKEIVEVALANAYTIIIIADHGNADLMQNEDGTPNTQHTTNPVPFVIVDKDRYTIKEGGKLGDLAPTILTLMGIDLPKEMTGNVLIVKK